MNKPQIKIELIKLDDYYERWEFTARVNPPLWVVMDISSGAIDRIVPALAKMIKEWNFIDEEGNPVECSEDGLKQLSIDLVMKVAAAFSDKVGNAEKN